MTLTLMDLGWSASFEQARAEHPDTLTPYRLTEIHRAQMNALGADGPVILTSPKFSAGELAVGDWVLAHPGNPRPPVASSAARRRDGCPCAADRGKCRHTVHRDLVQ